MRLDKYLRDCGYGTRSEIRKAVRSGHITLNGSIVRNPAEILDPGTDTVEVDGQSLKYTEYVYFMLNKPAGYITANKGNVPTVMDLVPEPYLNLFPVGRLDKDTEGLLLITNDGPLGHRLLSPRYHAEKEYYVEVDRMPSAEQLEEIRKGGLRFAEETFAPAEVRDVQDCHCRIILTEGKYHEVKRIFLALGCKVTYLKRIRMKDLILDETLEPGTYRRLTEDEISGLYA